MKKVKFRLIDKKNHVLYTNLLKSSFKFEDVIHFPHRFDLNEYIGIKDQNNEELCECDLIKVNHEVYEIKWDEDKLEYNLHKRFENKTIELNCDTQYEYTTFKKVGNLYFDFHLTGAKYNYMT